jgi:hypothetical protein
MSTLLQEELAEAMVKNKSLSRDKRKNKKELLVSVGYTTKTAEVKAKEIMNSKGVQDAFKAKGLTRDLIIDSLVEDIEKKPQKRTEELKLGADILGMREGDKNTNIVAVKVDFDSIHKMSEEEIDSYLKKKIYERTQGTG